MRGGGTPGRGERARVAERVRAILADAPGRSAAPASSADETERADPEPSPWLPGDDFAVQFPSTPMAVPGFSVPPPAPFEPVPAEAPRPAGLAERLATRLPVRIDPGRRGAIAVGLAVLVAAVVTGVWVFSSRPHAVPVTDTGTGPVAAVSTQGPTPSAGSLTSTASSAAPVASPVVLVVDVAGKVRRPGLYRLPAGSRVDDAVHAAGGALPGVDLTSLNLAAKITDGQQIAVGAPGVAQGGSASGTGTAGSAASGPVDLNTASLEQLETLPGVGPVLGQHILDWRAAHGSFGTVDQLRDVSGIGDVKFAALRSRVTV